MNNTFYSAALLPLYFLFGQISAQNIEYSAIPVAVNDVTTPCITPEQYALLEQRCAHNIQALGLNVGPSDDQLPVALSWPLKAATGFNACSFYVVSAYVDQNTAAGEFTDWNCGTNTYDGHKGTDIALSPFPFYKMDHDQVEVIAAAAGTIIDKVDGNFDKNCGSNNLTANYIIIQHADGTRANYWHMKKNSLTSKSIGQTVSVGEFLGIVGSSGNSSGPHLHFEVWSGNNNTTYKDPFAGSCNTQNANSWWANQKPYTEPAINDVSINTTDITFPACPTTETLNESSCYAIPFQGAGLPAGFAKFYVCLRNETTGMTADMSILNPNGSVFSSWTYSSTANNKVNIRAWSKTLPTTTGTYTFKAVYNGLTCTKTFDVINAVITASGSTAICAGTSVTLQTVAASTYLWNNGATTQSIAVSDAGDYAVTITNANGCTDASLPTTITVKPAPLAQVSANGPTVFCQGNSVQLTAAAASTYAWSNGVTTQSIQVSNTGNYIVTVTGANGCTAASTPAAITVNPSPSAQISTSGPTVFCQGGSVQLTASAASTYVWSNGASTQTIPVSSSGNFVVTVTNANGCTAASTPTAVTVNPNPSALISASGPTVFCQGGSVQLTASAASTYAWSNGASTQTIPVSSSGNFVVTVTSANGCTAASTPTAVTVNPNPSALISASGPTVFCQGGSVQLTASAASTYAWSNGANTQTIPVSSSGNFVVTVTSANGCTAASTPTAVTVNPNPSVQISASGPTMFCQGDSVQLTASAASSYAWSNGASTQTIPVSSSGNFVVTVTSVNGCTAATAPTLITVNSPQNGLSFLIQGDTLISPYSQPNNWYQAGNPTPIASGMTYKCGQTGNYYVIGQDIHFCPATSATAFVLCSPSDVSDALSDKNIRIYPTPTEDILNLSGSGLENGEYIFSFRNSIGQVLLTKSLFLQTPDIALIFSLLSFPNGTYTLSMEKKGRGFRFWQVIVMHQH